ncbi:MAG TPA: hypothetical protein VN641_05275 [Urbifossiella sp.]|nr:hypothetical protein [Urbifossiella sp.]
MSTLPPLTLSIGVDSEEQRIDLMHAISAVVRRIKSPDHIDPAERYWDSEFTKQLLEHLHRAKRKAIAEDQGY